MTQLEDVVVARLDIQRAMIRLSPRYQEVVRLRFGLGDCGPHTLEEAGKVLGVSRERARQMEIKAIRVMRGALDRKFAVARGLRHLVSEKPAPVAHPEYDEMGYAKWLALRKKEKEAKRAADALKRAQRKLEECRLDVKRERARSEARANEAREKAARMNPWTRFVNYWGGVAENIDLIVADGMMNREQATAWVLR